MKKILVTGAYGYIGSHTVKALAENGYHVVGLDISRSSNNIEKYLSQEVIIHDVSHKDHRGEYDAIVHLAGAIDIEESVRVPWKYVRTNIEGTFNTLVKYSTDNFIFASTASAFNPVSPYAQTKLLAENIIKAYSKNYSIFRFFNVAGNNGEFRQIGNATHLIRIAAEVAAGKRPYITINGTDWDTRDGTCIRDYVHVSDLADCIVNSIENPSNSNYECIGSGIGHTVREVIDAMKIVSEVDFQVVEGPRRPGDSAELIMPEDKSIKYYGSRTLEDMCMSAYQMELKS